MSCLFKESRLRFVSAERIAVFVALVVLAAPLSEAGTIIFDADVTPNVIVGSDITNGGFTVDRDNGVELGLRAKLRYNSSGLPENTFNSNGDGSYNFVTGQSFAPANRLVWSFEWSINTNVDGVVPGWKLGDLTYLLEMDFDSTSGTNFQSFDPINSGFFDHAFGNNSTAQSAGEEASPATYNDLVANSNVAQNSWNYGFFDDATHILPHNVPGIYDIRLTAYDNGTVVSATQITVNATVNSTVPEPASMLTFAGLGLCALGMRRKRRRA